jgi:hypothetical protein
LFFFSQYTTGSALAVNRLKVCSFANKHVHVAEEPATGHKNRAHISSGCGKGLYERCRMIFAL